MPSALKVIAVLNIILGLGILGLHCLTGGQLYSFMSVLNPDGDGLQAIWYVMTAVSIATGVLFSFSGINLLAGRVSGYWLAILASIAQIAKVISEPLAITSQMSTIAFEGAPDLDPFPSSGLFMLIGLPFILLTSPSSMYAVIQLGVLCFFPPRTWMTPNPAEASHEEAAPMTSE